MPTAVEIIHVERSYWYELAIAATIVYVVLAPAIAARAADLRIVAAVPAVGQTAAAGYAVLQLLRAIEAMGPEVVGTRATAAGLSEAIVLWSVGAAGSAVSGVLIAAGLASAREARTALGSVTLAVSGLAALATGALMLYIAWTPPGIPPGPRIAAIPLTLSAAGLASGLATLIWPWDRQQLGEARLGWLWTFAGIAGGAAGIMILVSCRLTAYAAGH